MSAIPLNWQGFAPPQRPEISPPLTVPRLRTGSGDDIGLFLPLVVREKCISGSNGAGVDAERSLPEAEFEGTLIGSVEVTLRRVVP